MVNNRKLFIEFDENYQQKVITANNQEELGKGIGTCVIQPINDNGDTSNARIEHVLYVYNSILTATEWYSRKKTQVSS